MAASDSPWMKRITMEVAWFGDSREIASNTISSVSWPIAASTGSGRAEGMLSSSGIRETVESLVVAFILAFLFRSFEAEAFVIDSAERERKTSEVGELIMSRLRRYDKVAYVRFASVYLDFKDVQEFMTELKDLLKTKESVEPGKSAVKN
jgi:hypothetical protein